MLHKVTGLRSRQEDGVVSCYGCRPKWRQGYLNLRHSTRCWRYAGQVEAANGLVVVPHCICIDSRLFGSPDGVGHGALTLQHVDLHFGLVVGSGREHQYALLAVSTKSSSFDIWSDEDLLKLQHKLNRRPRRLLNFFSSKQEFFLSLQRNVALLYRVYGLESFEATRISGIIGEILQRIFIDYSIRAKEIYVFTKLIPPTVFNV